MDKREYLHCSCGTVFHPDFEAEYLSHITNSGHNLMTRYEGDWIVQRLCVTCNDRRGQFAFGAPFIKDGQREWSYWICRPCIAQSLQRVGA